MGLGNTLTVVIPLVVLGYGVWLVYRMIRGRGKGNCGFGGCYGCPMRDSCETVQKAFSQQAPRARGKEDDANDGT